ncbi:amidohydrolase [Pararhodobacter zhoushanensis]|uniref:amidohydrolase n=1 Tax=Pararhodobacter zhoushanensis TaxID=2479545 RepID=UPI000F8F2CCB|nr:amidohydrolase [Pararhodobacter zhoushanensis]
MAETILYAARRIITMEPTQPYATHVAVRDGRILAVGGPEIAEVWGGARLDERFRDQVLLPGFVEAHSHMMTGALWTYLYCGNVDRTDPDGNLWPGVHTVDDMIDRMKGAIAKLPAGQPLVCWGFDPLFFAGDRLNRHHLDQASAEVPIAVMHQSFHLMTVNSKALEMAGYGPDTNAEGVVRLPDGSLMGELQEMGAMFPVMRRLNMAIRDISKGEHAIVQYGKAAVQTGVTTATDLMADLADDDVATLLDVTGRKDYPLRLVPALGVIGLEPKAAAARALELRAKSTDMLRMGICKVMTDGSIQGFTARVKWPGYIGGQPNGLWNLEPARLKELVKTLHASGLNMQVHTNGDEASDFILDCFEEAMWEHPTGDSRHTLQHCQMAGEDQFYRAARLGVCVNLFANHLWYYGDAHAEFTVGPDRAARMNACRSALDNGVTLAIHSDSPVTPLGPLHVAWCAVNRITPKGRVLGANQRLSVMEALHAITLGAARTLKLDREVGSITPGKAADFAVLGDDPLSLAPEALRDIPVLGTVQGGRVFVK